jgi:hypothetical protein
MIAELNRKYNQAKSERLKCLSLTESITLNKIPHDNQTIAYLANKIKDSVGIEYPENFFTKKNLFNSNYNDLSFRDFEKYFYLSELSGYGDSGREMLKQILNDGEKVIESPVLIKGTNEIYWQLIGNLQMMAYKVLGIFPVVREIPINANIVP